MGQKLPNCLRFCNEAQLVAAETIARNPRQKMQDVNARATAPNSSGERIQARIGTVTNFSPNVLVLDKLLLPTLFVIDFTLPLERIA
ncbi:MULTISPECIES: hypothetical protein [unclassified Sinorhizobium]|uniref:hypothetical protein n=1 Tax=unclassified Sinorhizobium TaxID=2613772 RepID=UPI003524C401